MAYEVCENGYLVSDARARLDYGVIHGFLSSCYWSEGVSLEQVRRQTEHSTLVFGLYAEQNEEPGAKDEAGAEQAAPGTDAATLPLHFLPQLGFARVLSDLTRFAYLCDVFVVPEAQGRGLGKRLVRDILAHPELADVRRWSLATKDAHGLYRQFGFAPPRKPGMWLFIEPDKARPGRWK